MNKYVCDKCAYSNTKPYIYPCTECAHGAGYAEHFTPIVSGAPEQTTIPPMPPVNPPKNPDEINHPTRYAGGKYECIDVMTDVFGVESVRNFCKLNAFKYLWREQNKNGVQDLKKCAWYLDKLIELSENTDENV